MKTHICPKIRAHLSRGAFYLVLLLALCAIPLALAQRNTGQPITAHTAQLPTISSDIGPATGSPPMPIVPTGGVLWDQYDNPTTEPPINIGSQSFEPAMAAFDDQAADDFVVTAPPHLSSSTSTECV